MRKKRNGGNYCALNEVVHRGDTVTLRDKDILRGTTKTQGQYEHAMKELLLELKLLVWYEGIKFEISKTDTYPPDFVTSLFVGGKQVIIELHGADDHYFQRMGRWRQLHGNRFYYILVKSCLDDVSETSIEVGKNGSHGEHVDEFWTMPRIWKRGRNTYNEKEIELWKTKMKKALIGLIEERADRCDDWEAVAALKNIKREQ